jgi:hypothetical protein
MNLVEVRLMRFFPTRHALLVSPSHRQSTIFDELQIEASATNHAHGATVITDNSLNPRLAKLSKSEFPRARMRCTLSLLYAAMFRKAVFTLP